MGSLLPACLLLLACSGSVRMVPACFADDDALPPPPHPMLGFAAPRQPAPDPDCSLRPWGAHAVLAVRNLRAVRRARGYVLASRSRLAGSMRREVMPDLDDALGALQLPFE